LQFENPDKMKPLIPEKVVCPYHKFHELKAMRGLENHLCNVCTNRFHGRSYRCDTCDYDLCLTCHNKDDFEQKKQEALEKLTKVKEKLIVLKEKNDLHARFKIPTEEPLTIKLLDTKWKELTRNCDKQTGDEKELARLNNLREIYWLDVSQKEQLLTIYQSYLTYRSLYDHLEKGLGLLKDVYERVKKIKQQLVSLLEKEDEMVQNHLLLQEVETFHSCVEVLLYFYDPLCSLLPRETQNDYSSRISLLNLNMLFAMMRLSPEIAEEIMNDLPPEQKWKLRLMMMVMGAN